jgi:hypothetical protein
VAGLEDAERCSGGRECGPCAAGAEGGDSQHIRLCTSRDEGRGWGPARCVMWGLNALWSPILHYHSGGSNGGGGSGGGDGGGGTDGGNVSGGGGGGVDEGDGGGGQLVLFYTESRKARSPGGDVKLMTSGDAGATWSAPRLVYPHEADGGASHAILTAPS